MNLSTSLLFVTCTSLSFSALANQNDALMKQAFSIARKANKTMRDADTIDSYQQAINNFQVALDILARVGELDADTARRLNEDRADLLWNMGVGLDAIAALIEANDVNQARDCVMRSVAHFDRAFELYRESEVHWTPLMRRRYTAYVDSVRARLDLLNPSIPAAAIIEQPPVPSAPATPVYTEVVERRKKRKQSEPRRSLTSILAANGKNFFDFAHGS